MACKRDEIVAENGFIFWLPEAKMKLVISMVIKLVDSSRGSRILIQKCMLLE